MNTTILEINNNIKKLDKSELKNIKNIRGIMLKATLYSYPQMKIEKIMQIIRKSFKSFKKENKITFQKAIKKNENLHTFYYDLLLKHYEISLINNLNTGNNSKI